MGGAGALLLIAVVVVGLLIIKLDERHTRRLQLKFGLTDQEACRCLDLGISFAVMAERKRKAAATIRRLYATMACMPRQPTVEPAPDSDTDGDPADPLVHEDGGSGRSGSGSHGGG